MTHSYRLYVIDDTVDEKMQLVTNWYISDEKDSKDDFDEMFIHIREQCWNHLTKKDRRI